MKHRATFHHSMDTLTQRTDGQRVSVCLSVRSFVSQMEFDTYSVYVQKVKGQDNEAASHADATALATS